MADALSALERIIIDVGKLDGVLASSRRKLIEPQQVSSLCKSIALRYYESVHRELQSMQEQTALAAEIDYVISTILALSTIPREKSAFSGQINELRPYLQKAQIAIMKARGTPRLVISSTERVILDTLAKMLPISAAAYEQVLRDITDGQKVSWRGTGGELRDILREVTDHLAPDDQVMAAAGFKLEGDLKRPTQKQKLQFILKARRRSAALNVAEQTLDTIEGRVADVGRSTYQRGSASAHAFTDAKEIRKIKAYVDALLVELLEISG